MRFLAVFLICAFLFPLHAYAIEEGEAAPDFSVTTVGGKDISYYNDIRGKRPLYLVFWSTW